MVQTESPKQTTRSGIRPGSIAILHTDVVLEDDVIEDGGVLIEDGKITQIGPCTEIPRDADLVIDGGHNSYLVAGLIDTHNDGIENEINPRPNVGFPHEYAAANYEARCIAAGVTTTFHAVSFASVIRKTRSVEGAVAATRAISMLQSDRACDHHILHRLDVWTPDGVDPVFASLRNNTVQAMSLNDHTPGQGQYRDLKVFAKTIAAYRDRRPDAFGGNGLSPEEEIQRRMMDRAENHHIKDTILERVKQEKRKEAFVLLSHDDDSPEKVGEMHELGCDISEFPVDMDAARRARELGMWITVGAPNIVRGGSTSGNLSATDLVEAGLADIICADYHAPSIMYSVFKLIRNGMCTVPEAFAKVTVNPARAFGLRNVGLVSEGSKADLTLVARDPEVPEVRTVIRGGSLVMSAGKVRTGVAGLATG